MSEIDLKAKLENEVDLVPCPNCNWINEEQIAVYRESRYQGLVGCLGVFAVFGVFLMALLAVIVIGRTNDMSESFCSWVFFSATRDPCGLDRNDTVYDSVTDVASKPN